MASSDEPRRAALEALFGVAEVDSLEALVDEEIRRLGLAPPAPLVADEEGDDDAATDPSDDDEPTDDPRELLWWLLRMAAHTHRREGSLSPENPRLVDAFDALVALRPEPDEAHAQMLIDATSSLARARAIRARCFGSVLAVGDDDATALALALLDRETSSLAAPRLAVGDIDPAVLAFLVAAGKSLDAAIDARRVDVFEDDPPADWRHAFDAAVTDPVRSFDACLAFLDYARACVRPGGSLFLADHPDWNLELPDVLAACEARGLRLEQTLPLLHAYPIDTTWIPDPDAKVRELEALGVRVDGAWFRRLVELTRGCTNLYVLRVDDEL